MELWLLAVGKLRPFYREACDDYLRRIGRRAKVHEVEVREAARAPTRAVQQAEEADRLRARIPPRARVVALAREGRGWTSAELAGRIARWEADARPLVFLVGGSTGLDPGLVTDIIGAVLAMVVIGAQWPAHRAAQRLAAGASSTAA